MVTAIRLPTVGSLLIGCGRRRIVATVGYPFELQLPRAACSAGSRDCELLTL